MSWAGPHQHDIGKTQPSQRPLYQARFDPQRRTLLCLSHLRWSFVYQRPQHLMSRFARDYNLLFWEEPVHGDEVQPWLEARAEEGGIQVLVPHIPHGSGPERAASIQRRLLDGYLAELGVGQEQLLLWYYTPMSLSFSRHLRPKLTIYDCMDELSAFLGAPPELVERERELLKRADVVFTGGHSIWEVKRQVHGNAHPMPSSVDTAHFATARQPQVDPADQAGIAHPRMGFYGVIDERLDLELIDHIAALRPDWQWVLVGPVVKIDPAILPRRDNIHYLGGKTYDDLPRYLGGWSVALMPFALNESTRFISPTKTPEYLAGGCPVVSTAIVDVERSYGDSGLVLIARSADGYIEAIERALALARDRPRLLADADRILGDMSWERTWTEMKEKIQCAM